MVLSERIGVLQYIFDELVDTSSLNEKREIVNHVPAELKEDFEFCIECLNGVHKFGFTYEPCTGDGTVMIVSSVKELLEYLLEPYRTKNLTQWNINFHIARTYPYAEFLEQIVNRTLKLGIGKSILPKDGLSAMLAKKYEGKVKYSRGGYFVTEKLDGNRCIARYDGTKWIFTSRNGKVMHVDFDMSGLPTEYVYDGEVLAPPQVQMSNSIYNMIVNNVGESRKFEGVFNSTSGLINQHTLNKKLIYNIFDIMIDGVSYMNRRDELDNINCKCELSDDVRILPVLARFNDASELNDNIANILNKVVDVGGEGVMINLANGSYLHKRTDELLKFKMVQSMDMKVISVVHGSGKYEGMIGAIYCKATTPDGKEISCSVGSGLSDKQRLEWVIDANRILGKIVEVAYFDVSQNSEDRGTNRYSLRFPRLKKVREDKSETSVF